jgi:hypothetical protein
MELPVRLDKWLIRASDFIERTDRWLRGLQHSEPASRTEDDTVLCDRYFKKD